MIVRAQENKAPAPAEPVKISGQVRLRSELDDRRLTAGEAVFVHLLRSRLRATARPLSWLTVVAEIQDSRYLGQSDPSQSRGTTDASADGLDMHQAWGEIDDLFDIPLSLRLGRQEITFGNERLMGVSNWSNTGRSFDGARLMYRAGDLSIDAWGARLSAPVMGPTASQNLYGIWSTWKPVRELAIDLFDLEDNNSTIVRRGVDSGEAILGRNTFGTYIRGSAGPIDVELEGAGQVGKNAPNDSVARRSIRAFMGSATVTATILPESKTRITALATVLSGDGSAGDSTNETFSTLFGTNHRFYGLSDYLPDLSGDFGLVDLMGGISTSPWNNFKLAAEGHLFKPQRKRTESFGTEFNLVGTWQAGSQFEFSGGAALFTPGEVLKARLSEDPRFWGYLSAVWQF
jgi:hypothetical protein